MSNDMFSNVGLNYLYMHMFAEADMFLILFRLPCSLLNLPNVFF